MSDGLIHGPELDRAIEASVGPDELGICQTVLDSRGKAYIDPENRALARKALMDSGRPFDDETVDRLQIRSVIGGAFSHGIAEGLALAEQRSLG